MLVAIFVVATKAFRKQKDDPRISSALQLLQSKIAVLEDLSDRTDQQVNQLVRLMEAKSKEVQQKIGLAEKHIELIKQSMDKSLEVAKIFEDKIPHEEIIDRQTTYEYVKAARLAHQGMSLDEIAKHVSIPRGELEILSKVNREQLVFTDETIPDWAIQRFKKEESKYIKELESVSQQANVEQAESSISMRAFDSPQVDEASLESLSEQFKEACQRFADEHNPTQQTKESDISERVKSLTGEITESLGQFLRSESKPAVPANTAKDELLPMPEELDLDAIKTANVAQNKIQTETLNQPTEKSAKINKQDEPVVRKVVFPNLDMKP